MVGGCPVIFLLCYLVFARCHVTCLKFFRDETMQNKEIW